MSSTELSYYLDSSTTGTATVVSRGKDGEQEYVILDRTLFHPAGGGQKSDVGTIGGVPVASVEKRYGEILHLFGTAPGLETGSTAGLEVDAATRRLHSRYHTAGHLVGSIVEQVLNCKAVSGQHWPGESFMRFEPGSAPTDEQLQQIRDQIAAAIAEDRAVSVAMQGETRLVTIDGWAAVPCGGTHLPRIGAIGSVELGTPKVKQRRLQISYRLADA
jgi:Ser-tRNA(Ala) deacylase AlaX